jgi:DNA-binding NtrC family response regulator
MLRLFERIGRVARSPAPVLITGETGTGKELVAEALHRASGREALVPVNCGAIPDHLLESELFGHVKGAFTGADRDKQGLFAAAHGGTLFLDEIAELPLPLQPKLLRVLESGEMRRVGEVAPQRVDVRLLAATHRDLAAAVEQGRFREDLLFRVNVLQLEVPPLRERATDIPLLAERFLERITAGADGGELRFSAAALAALIAYPWPGNVRELLNVVQRAVVLTEGSEITPGDLPSAVAEVAAAPARGRGPERELTLAEVEREHTLGVLRRCGGNKSRAAELLDIPRRTLYRRLQEYGVLAEEDGTPPSAV